MKLLLDTHALLWFLAGDEKLPARVQDAIVDPLNTVFISAVSAIEIATKNRIGKLPQAGDLARDFIGVIQAQGFVGLPVGLEHARFAGSLQHAHRDPFDRLLIAQAIVDDLQLVSNQVLFDDFGVKRFW